MTTPNVSICIPSYEQPESLSRTLESVFRQTYTDFEVIVTDDSATSAIETAIMPWRSDGRLRYVRNLVRQGSPANWNTAIGLARGNLIKVMHHDDWLSEIDGLAEFVALIEDRPQVMFAFCAAHACDAAGRVIREHAPTRRQLAELAQDPRCLFFANFVGAPSATIVRREAGLRFDPNLRWLVDVEAYIRMLRANPAYAFSPRPLVSITAAGPRQVTREVLANPTVQFLENVYVARRLGFQGVDRLRVARRFAELAGQLNEESVTRVRRDPLLEKAPIEVRGGLWWGRACLKPRRLAAQVVRRLHGRGRHGDFRKLSYSQCGEDMIVDFLLMWLGLEEITYLDIGANHPVELNNTYFFYCKGHSGVLIEPDPDLCGALASRRPRDRCLNIAIGVSAEPVAKMYVMTSRTLSTTLPSQAIDYESYGREKVEKIIEVRQGTINDVLSLELERTPNFVSLDVEGLDFEILKSWDFARFKPEIFCVETLTFSQDGTERKLTEIGDYMAGRGYFAYADTYINTIFVSRDAWRRRRT